MENTRVIATSVAASVLRLLGEERWTPGEAADAALKLALRVKEIDADLGAVCEESYYFTRIEEMSAVAFALCRLAISEAAVGRCALSWSADLQLLHPAVHERLASGHGVIAIAR